MTADADTDLARCVLDAYPRAIRTLGAPEALGNAGGLSGAALWRFESASGPLVLRAWPGDGPDDEALSRIHHWIGRLSPLPFMPKPIAASDGRTFRRAGGRLWEVAPWMPGSADPSPGLPRLRAAMAGLAEVHRRLAVEETWGRSPGVARRAQLLRGLLDSGFAEVGRALESRPLDDVACLARAWLDEARRRAPGALAALELLDDRPFRLQPCLRDARAVHFLFEGERLTGLVDFGAIGVDAPACDLARLLGDWGLVGGPGREAALIAYEAGRPMSPEEWPLLAALETANAPLIGARWARWRYVEDRADEAVGAVADGFRRSLALMGRPPIPG